MARLTTPTVSLSGNTMNITYDDNANYIEIYKNGALYETITVKEPKGYTLTLSGIGGYGFEKISNYNPNTTIYDGTYRSTNYNINSSYAVMKVSIYGYTTFSVWINSYAESNYDYVVCSDLDASTYPTVYSSSKSNMSTRGFQKSPSTFSTSNWRQVTYSGIDGGSHYFYITYRKDSSAHSSDDRGYVLIPKNQ